MHNAGITGGLGTKAAEMGLLMNRGGFSWARFFGASRAKSRASRFLGVPLTRSGRERKLGAFIMRLFGL